MIDVDPPFDDPAVEAKFASFPEPARTGALRLRRLIFETAEAVPAVGSLAETLKWGQPAYLTPESRSGTTIRLGLSKQGGFALYVHCQTTILAEFNDLFADALERDGNRGILFQDADDLPFETLRLLVKRALTYHLGKRR